MHSARGNLYFAPYFTRRTAGELSEHNLVPVGEGVSYLSKIKDIQVLPTAKVLEFLKARGDIEDPKRAAELVRQGHRERDIMLLILGKPYLIQTY